MEFASRRGRWRVTPSTQALAIFAERLDAFEGAYRAAVARALALGRTTAVCTVYNGALDADQAVVARVGLALLTPR